MLAPVYFDYGGVRTQLGAGTFVNHGAYFMDGGSILEESTPEEFFASPKTQRARDFLNSIHSHER